VQSLGRVYSLSLARVSLHERKTRQETTKHHLLFFAIVEMMPVFDTGITSILVAFRYFKMSPVSF
jgi:hypothetical protein